MAGRLFLDCDFQSGNAQHARPGRSHPSARVSTQTRPHMYVENVPVCTGTTHTCFNTCARCAGIHGDVLNVHMGTCLSGHTGFFQRFTPHHNTAHTTQTTHHTTTQDTTPHGDRQRQTETETDETKEKKTKQEKREERNSFSVWWCMAVFSLMQCFVLFVPSTPDSSACQTSVRYDSSFISFSASWQVNSFSIFCELFILCSYSFEIYAATIFPRCNSAQVFCGRVLSSLVSPLPFFSVFVLCPSFLRSPCHVVCGAVLCCVCHVVCVLCCVFGVVWHA